MLKLLLADDERIIREGISKIMKWEEMGTSLIGVAQDGLEAYEIIIKEQPDILITDIKMPRMNGLELIRRLKEDGIDIGIIVLSGYGEFELAREAMQYGVKNYLLKPCNEEKIRVALEKLILEITQKKEKEEFYEDIKQKLSLIIPQVKDQFLRDFAITRMYSQAECGLYKELFNIKEDKFQIVLLKLEKDFNHEKSLAVKNIAEEIIGHERVFLNTVIKESQLLLIKPTDMITLISKLKKIQELYQYYYNGELTIAISGENEFNNIPLMYQEACEYLEFMFYTGSGSIISQEDVNFNKTLDGRPIDIDFSQIAMSVRNGNTEELIGELDRIFRLFGQMKYETSIIKTYCMDLFLTIIRQCKNDKVNDYTKMIVKISELETSENIQKLIQATACEIAINNYNNNIRRNSSVIKSVINSINDNFADEDLSLTMIAEKILYMNVDYLGKLFKKEMKIKFSQYLLNFRMEKAKQFLEMDRNLLTCDLARKIGFGENPRYFDQVFKKYTGFTPSQYKKNH